METDVTLFELFVSLTCFGLLALLVLAYAGTGVVLAVWILYRFFVMVLKGTARLLQAGSANRSRGFKHVTAPVMQLDLEIEEDDEIILAVEETHHDSEGGELGQTPFEPPIDADKLGRQVPPQRMSLIGRWRYRRALRQQARIDYQSARGTIHKGQIQACLKKLGAELYQLQKQEAQDLQKLKNLDKRRQEALRKALTDHLVRDRLIEVNGIGFQTADRIRRMVYKDRLSNLHHTQPRLQGVGDAKQASISRWARRMEKNLPTMLEGEFPGKSEVLESNRSEERLIQLSLRVAREDLADLEELRSTAEDTLGTLIWASDTTYYKLLLGEEHRSLEAYNLGVFPPWEQPPAWFGRLLNEFGG